MNDALTVCTIQGIRQIERDLKGLLRRQLIVIARQQHLVEGLPRNKFHDDVRSVRFGFLAYIEDGYNSRVRQAARRFCFPEKPLAILEFLFRRLTSQGNRLHSDHTIDLGITRFIDDTHRSPAQLGQDLVATKTLGSVIVHRGDSAASACGENLSCTTLPTPAANGPCRPDIVYSMIRRRQVTDVLKSLR